MAPTKEQLEALRMAQEMANEAIESGNEAFRSMGDLLQRRLKETNTLGTVNKSILHNLSRQLNNQKAQLTTEDKKKNLGTSMAYIKKQIAKFEKDNAHSIADGLKQVLKGLEAE